MKKATTDYAKEGLKLLGITDSESLALWARRKGLLSVYIEFRPKTTFQSGAWQVVRPGYKTDPKGLAINKGRKTFTYDNLAQKHAAETRAKEWADHTYGGDSVIGWYRIDGFGPNLFPKSVVRELQSYLPDLAVWENRQHSNKSTKKKVKK